MSPVDGKSDATYETTMTSPLLSFTFTIPSFPTSLNHLDTFFHSLLPTTTSSRWSLGMYAGRFGRMCAEYRVDAGMGHWEGEREDRD